MIQVYVSSSAPHEYSLTQMSSQVVLHGDYYMKPYVSDH
jgi:hypothetical protein